MKTRIRRVLVTVVTAATVLGMAALIGEAQQAQESCPLHAQHMKERSKAEVAGHGDAAHAGMLARGKSAMGFDQRSTSHHFRLSKTGGFIEVHVNDPSDAAAKTAVTDHLRTIAAQFSQGDFSTPRQVHAETPDGVADLKRLGASVTYTFEAGDLGARVRLVGRNPEAIAAIHTFLRYQIREHRTGDWLDID